MVNTTVPRRIAAIIAATAIVVGACSTAATPSPSTAGGSGGGGAGKVALLLPENHTARYEAADKPFFEAKLKATCPSVAETYANATENSDTQQSQAEAAISNGATVLVLDPVNGAAAGGIMKAAADKGVKVISYDRLITAANSKPDWYISFDNEKVGELQGTALLAKLQAMGKTNPKVIWINGSPKDNNATLFKQGAHKVLDGKVTIVKEDAMANWQQSEAQAIMDGAITQFGKDGFDGIYVANDGGAAGVYASEVSKGVDPTTKPMTGQDATVDAIQRILAGQQYMTIYKAIQPEAEAAAELACNLAQGKADVPSDLSSKVSKVNNGFADIQSILLDPIPVTADGSNGTKTVKDTVVADKFYGPDTVAQICKGDTAKFCSQAGIQ